MALISPVVNRAARELTAVRIRIGWTWFFKFVIRLTRVRQTRRILTLCSTA
jgi:hypothetical protein